MGHSADVGAARAFHDSAMTTNDPTIVAGYDGSPASRAAVERAVDLASPGGRVVVVHAYDVPRDYVGSPFYDDMMAVSTKAGRHDVEELEETCPGLRDVEYESALLVGDPARAILGIAKTHAPDLIVVGTHGRGRVGSMLLGSVAQHVIHDAECPVLVIPQRALAVQGV